MIFDYHVPFKFLHTFTAQLGQRQANFICQQLDQPHNSTFSICTRSKEKRSTQHHKISPKGECFDNGFTKRNCTIMSWNLIHLARMLKANSGYPNTGNDRNALNDGELFGFRLPG